MGVGLHNRENSIDLVQMLIKCLKKFKDNAAGDAEVCACVCVVCVHTKFSAETGEKKFRSVDREDGSLFQGNW